jgi:peptide/nickel transport system substrate-binding protein
LHGLHKHSLGRLDLSLMALLLVAGVACATAAPETVGEEASPTAASVPSTDDIQTSQPTAEADVPTAAPAPTTAAAVTAPSGTLNVGQKELGPFIGHPSQMPNPQIFVMSTALTEGLIRVDSSLEVAPFLAESWDISDDFLTWTFNLQQGVQFHHGYGEMTAEDVVWSYNQWADNTVHPRSANVKNVWQHPQGSVETPDQYTVVLNTGEPWSQVPVFEFLRNTGGSATGVFSRQQTEELGAEAASDQIATTGPWQIADHRTSEFWRMEAVEGHWRQTPHFAELVFREIPEESARIAGFQTGQLDTTLIAFDSIPVIEEVPEAKLMQIPGGGEAALTFYGQYYVGIGTQDQQPGYDADLPWVSADPEVGSPEWEKAKKVRIALSSAIDRQAIVDTLLRGHGEPAVLWDFGNYEDTWLDPDMRWEYDPERAKALLEEAGYPDGFSINLTPSIRGAPVEVEACEAIADMWRNIGVEVNFQNIPYGTLRPNLINRNYQGSTCHAGSIRMEPGQGYSGMLSEKVHGAVWNRGVEHPWFDEKIAQHMATPDPEARRELGLEIARFLFDNALTGIGLYNFDAVWPVGSRIQEWDPELISYGDLRNINGYEYIQHRQAR